MLYHHVFRYRSGVSAVSAVSAFAELFSVRPAVRQAACLTPRRRRAPSLWGLGAAAGLLSFPLRARSSESDSGPDPDPAELAGELCPVLTEGALVAPEESCDLPAEAASASREPALLTVLGSDVRLEDLPGLPGLPEQQEGLVLPQAPEGTAASGGGLFGLSWPVVALVGGGGLLAVAVIASGGSDSDDGGGTSGSGGGGDNGGAMNATPAVVTTGMSAAPATLTEGMAVSLDVSDWFSDPDAGDTLTYTAMGNPDWLVLDAMTGALTVAAMDEAEVGTYTFTVTASDGDGETATHTVTLTIEDSSPAPDGMSASNEAPETTTLAETSLTATEGEAATWTVSGWFADPDAGDTLTYAATLQKTDAAMAAGLPDWLALDAMTGALTIASGATDDPEVGFYTLVLTASDGDGETAMHTLLLTISDDPTDGMVTDAGPPPDPLPGTDTTPGGTDSNSPPVTTTDAETSLTADEGAAADWDVSDWFEDPDTGDTLTYTLSDEPDWLELDDSNGELTIAADTTDDADVDSHVFVITASDDDGEEATLTVTLTVESTNAAPTIVSGSMAPPATITADEGGSAQSFTLATWFSDPDGDTLAFALGKDGPDWATINTAMGILNLAFGDTDDADVGSHTLVVTASDPDDEAVSHSVVVTVENVNDAPVAASGAPAMLTAMEGLAAMWTVSDWFTDEDAGDELTYTATGLPDWLGLNAMGTLTIEARATDDAEIGTYVLAVTASDKADATAVHTTTLEITDTANEPTLSAALPNRIAPATGMTLMLDLGDFFTDLDEAGEDAAAALTFAISESVPGTGDTNIITAMITGAMLELTPGTGTIVDGLWQQETVSITATDSDGKQAVAEFAVTTRAHVLNTSTLVPSRGFIIQGDTRDNQLGFSAAGAGDVNGDGLADLVAGALLGDDGGMNAGEAYIIYGKADPADEAKAGTQFGAADSTAAKRRVVDTTSLAPADGFIIQGDGADDQLGRSVSGAGDVNGDGLDDLIVGAHLGNDGGGNAGEAYIIYGKTGTGDGTQFGMAVRLAADGTTTITDGTTPDMSVVRQVLDTSMLAPADGFILLGDMSGDQLGVSVAGAGDVNGDGLDDLITGAHLGDDSGADAGEAYIVYGKADPADETKAGTQFGMTGSGGRQVLDTTDLAPADGFIIRGVHGSRDGPVVPLDERRLGDKLGTSVAGAGDINGDGIEDLIIGAIETFALGAMFYGEAYIVYGKAGTQFGTAMNDRQILDIANLAPADGFILRGDAHQDQLGRSVAGVGDINGDGIDDLIVGAPEGDDGGNTAGEAYIVYGKAGNGTQFGTMVTTTLADGMTIMPQLLDTTNLAPDEGFIIQGDAANDVLGMSVAGAGDVNGDGLADLAVGAYQADHTGGSDAGEAYIIYGKAGTNGMQFGITGSGGRQVLDTTDFLPTDGFILQGSGLDFLGASVSGAGDIDGDGYDDLIAGAHWNSDGGNKAGASYIVYGGTHLGGVVIYDQTLVGGMVPTLAGDATDAAKEAAARMAFLHGGAGDDRLEAHADTTVLYGGAGDDTLELVDWSFHRVDGGSGSDTLVLGSGVVLDFTLATVRGKVRGIETLSLSDGAEATLNLVSVYALVESRNNGGTHTDAGEAFLRLEGTGMVSLEGGTWTETPNAEGTADLWTQGSAKLLVDDGLDVA